MTRRSLVSTALFLSLALAACGDNLAAIDPAPDAGLPGTPDAPTFTPAPHPAAPQVIGAGGPVLATPVVVPIFFTGDGDFQAETEKFLGQLATSDYWHATTSEYGVGPLTIKPTIVSTDPVPTTDSGLQAWIETMTDGTHAGWPVADANTIFAVFLPKGAIVSEGGSTSCVDYGAYHNEGMTASGQAVIYALMPRCGGASVLDNLTVSTSHELVEAATDPLPFTAPAFVELDAEHYVWGQTPGGELGDMCEYVAAAPQRLVGLYQVQRSWSNASAAAGHDPCVPAMTTPYLGVAPVLDEDIMLMTRDGAITTKGVAIPVSTSKTIEVDLFSDGPTGDWTVEAVDVASALRGQAAQLTFAWDKTTGHNGDKLMLTITHAVSGRRGSEFYVSASDGTKTQSLWFGLVGN
ncbi:MAG: hypothetical protein K8W52_09980 [Deltaproteobacteria bacterium]|nr:hypothetical protein [Deltaproteobacteria bacterium]